MKKLIIISPHFPPTNGADMHRIRQSLPFFESQGWQPTVVAVNPSRVETAQDPLLSESLPRGLRIIWVNALSTHYTRKLGLGSLALRSLPYYWKTVNALIRQEQFDLIYFSTTQFPVMILGAYWQKRFGVPYVIDIQDPWHSDYYENNPKAERPAKYWFSYRLNKWLEPIAMRRVAAIITVSAAYSQTLCARYTWLRQERCYTITFGAFQDDMAIARRAPLTPLNLTPEQKSVVYVGRGGDDMQRAIRLIFRACQLGLVHEPALFSKLRFFFFGTSYAPSGQGKPTLAPVAENLGLGNMVQEIPDRLPYFQALRLLSEADLLLIPGSDDAQYTASKIYPYILAGRPSLAVFHEQSSAADILREVGSGPVVTFGEDTNDEELTQNLYQQWVSLLDKNLPAPKINQTAFEPHLARAKTKAQVEVFDQVITDNR